MANRSRRDAGAALIAVPLMGGCVLLSPDEISARKDIDADGLQLGEDCDDRDPTVGAAAARFRDDDGDGFGAGEAHFGCLAAAGWAATAGDCDDADAQVRPGAEERCDGLDNDCDGLVDDDDPGLDPAGRVTVFPDRDGDGWGDTSAPVIACAGAPGTVVRYGDCDDDDPALGDEQQDRDCDGVLTPDDCDDAEPRLGAIEDDRDCDGLPSAEDCDDADPHSYAVALDGDCDGLPTSIDCDDADPLSTSIDEDGDCDGVLTEYDCDDADPDRRDALGGPARWVEGMAFAELCPHRFEQGCTPGMSACLSNEHPVTTVRLTQTTLIGQTEVTQATFLFLMGYNPARSDCGPGCPVEDLSWHEAAAFANRVSEGAGLSACYRCTGVAPGVACEALGDPYTCGGYRLPTEAEWEAAARCGDDLLFSGATTEAEVAWLAINSGGAPQPVGALAPNACGIYDMSGNVSEWTHDWFDAYPGGLQVDPTGALSGLARVHRGGSWSSGASMARVSARSGLAPTVRSATLGLRLARSTP